MGTLWFLLSMVAMVKLYKPQPFNQAALNKALLENQIAIPHAKVRRFLHIRRCSTLKTSPNFGYG